jgi:hypothetical protein
MSNYGLTLSAPIAAAVSGKKLAYEDPATGVASNPNVAKAKCMGVFPEDVAASEGMAPVQVEGVQEVIAGGAISIGDSVTCDNTGRAVTAAGAGGEKVWCVGFARTKVTTAGDIVDVLIHPHLVVI